MTLEFVGLVGMLFTLQMTIRDYFSDLYKSHIWAFCFFRILSRFFGLSSGCVAFLMAIERYFALTKPFWYCKHFTNGLMKRMIIVLWSLAAILSFSPVFGFGTYFDHESRKCLRYREATKPLDVTYAFIFFFVGEDFSPLTSIKYLFQLSHLTIIGSILCIFMVICNVSVTRMVYSSYRNMKQLTRSSLENFNRIQAIKFRHQISEVSTSSSTTTKSFSLITRDEIEFINMVNLLTASFVICWGTSMVSLPKYIKHLCLSGKINIIFPLLS
jgi:prostaglandin E receptor 4